MGRKSGLGHRKGTQSLISQRVSESIIDPRENRRNLPYLSGIRTHTAPAYDDYNRMANSSPMHRFINEHRPIFGIEGFRHGWRIKERSKTLKEISTFSCFSFNFSCEKKGVVSVHQFLDCREKQSVMNSGAVENCVLSSSLFAGQILRGFQVALILLGL